MKLCHYCVETVLQAPNRCQGTGPFKMDSIIMLDPNDFIGNDYRTFIQQQVESQVGQVRYITILSLTVVGEV